jgi:hypothetical protein
MLIGAPTNLDEFLNRLVSIVLHLLALEQVTALLGECHILVEGLLVDMTAGNQ